MLEPAYCAGIADCPTPCATSLSVGDSYTYGEEYFENWLYYDPFAYHEYESAISSSVEGVIITLYGEEFPNLKYSLPLTFWSNLST